MFNLRLLINYYLLLIVNVALANKYVPYLKNCFYCVISRTPLIAAMHEDDSPDLEEVRRILRDNLEVDKAYIFCIDSLSLRLSIF